MNYHCKGWKNIITIIKRKNSNKMFLTILFEAMKNKIKIQSNLWKINKILSNKIKTMKKQSNENLDNKI